MKAKKLYLLFNLLLFTGFCFSQKYGNEWVRYNQTYYKFPVLKEGVYRIDSTTLSTRFNLQSVDPRNFQVFLKGKELPLYIKGESDGQLNTNDYIEFYANNLRRDYDSLLYGNVAYMPNPYKPFFNDTIFAYITVNSLLNNKRFAIETDSSIYNYTLSDHYYSYGHYNLPNSFNFVRDVLIESSDPRYTQPEGFGQIVGKGGNLSVFVGLSTFTGSPLPSYFNIAYSGSDLNVSAIKDHQVRVSYTNSSNSTVVLNDSVFYGFNLVKLSYTIKKVVLVINLYFTFLSVSSPSFATFNNNTILHYFHLFYPKQPTLSGALSNMLYVKDATSSSKSSLILANPNSGSTGTIVAYDITNDKKLPVYILNGNARVVVPNSGSMKKVFMQAESDIIKITTLQQVNQNQVFTNFKASNASIAFVIIYHPSLQSSAQVYANYRQSSQGGAYDVIIANINELYEQFGYGINKHPQAIRNFVKYLHDSLPAKPSYVFLIGKGVHITDLHNGTQQYNLIPTMGVPSSDNLLTAGITNSTNAYPEIPVGRLAALTATDVNSYLAKVQQHEASGLTEWKKNVIHFIGGDTPLLTNLLEGYMDSYEQTIKDTLFGAYVHEFKKNTTAPIQTVISDSIKQTINNGAALMTFFGHGSDQNFDQAIDDPEVYNNTGKYPFVFANSCYSGNMYIPGVRSVSERFVFSNQKGSIGFLATSSIGYVNSLHFYSTWFYKNLSYLNFGKGIGDIAKEAAFQSSFSFDKINRYTALDMALHGDPSIKLNGSNLSDYQFFNNDVKFITQTYTVSIGLTIHYKNIGKAVKDSFFVKIDRFFPNNDSVSYLKQIKAPYYKDSLKFYIPLDFVRGIGLNKFKIKLDQFNEMVEVTKSNNATIGTVDLFIRGGDIVPVYPYKYAVVPLTNSITLKASTSDPFAPSFTYKFQLDTCDKFINPIAQTNITSSGGVLEWNVNLPFNDSTVYFWRVSKDSTLPSDRIVWRESSFQTIGTKNGWSQAHFNQFKNNTYRFVSYNKNQRRFDFYNNVHALKVRNGMYPFIAPISINFFFNNLTLSSWGCAPDGWNFAVFDSIS